MTQKIACVSLKSSSLWGGGGLTQKCFTFSFVEGGRFIIGGGKFQNRVNYPGHVTGECAGRSTQYVTARGVNREGGEWHLHTVGPEKRGSLDNLEPGIHYCVLYIIT